MRKGEATRRQIIRSSAEVMNRQGFLATPISEVTRRARITKGGLYNHFASLHELSLASFDYAGEKLLAFVTIRLAVAGSASERLHHLIAGLDDIGGREGPFAGGCPILNAAIEADDNDEALRKHASRVARAIEDALQDVIADGIASTEFPYDLDAKRAARCLFAMFEGGVMLTRLHRDGSVLNDIKRGLGDVIDGWKRPKPPAKKKRARELER